MKIHFIAFIVCSIVLSSCIRTPKVNEPVSKLCDAVLENCNSSQFKGYQSHVTVSDVVEKLNPERQNIYNTDNKSFVDSTRYLINNILICDSVKYYFYAVEREEDMYTSRINNIGYYFENVSSEDSRVIMDSLKARLVKIYNATDDAASLHTEGLDIIKHNLGDAPSVLLVSSSFNFTIVCHSQTILLDAWFK